jgi:hypothetical protein
MPRLGAAHGVGASVVRGVGPGVSSSPPTQAQRHSGFAPMRSSCGPLPRLPSALAMHLDSKPMEQGGAMSTSLIDGT